MHDKEAYPEIVISEKLLSIGSFFFVTFLSFCVITFSIFFILWQHDREVEGYFQNLIREIHSQEYFIEKSQDLVKKILYKIDTQEPLPALDFSAPELLWSIDVNALHAKEKKRLTVLATHFMLFDEYWRDGNSESTFLITPDAKFFVLNEPSLKTNPVQAHLIKIMLDKIKQTTVQASTKTAIWGEYQDPIRKKIMLTYVIPIFDINNNLILYLGRKIDPAIFLHNDYSVNIPAHESVKLLNQNKLVIAQAGDVNLNTTENLIEFNLPFLKIYSITLNPRVGTISFSHRIAKTGWSMIYSLQIQKILWYQAPIFSFFLIFLLLSIIGVYHANRFIRLHAIEPARHRAIALRESEEFAYEILNTAPVALAVIDPSQPSLQASNPIYDQSIDLLKILGPKGITQLHQQLYTRESNKIITQLVREVMIDKTEKFYSITVTRKLLQKRSVLIFAITDVTIQKQQEKELLVSRNTIASAIKEKDAFLATVSHELRTPLYGMLASLELMIGTPLNEQQHYYVDAMEGSCRNLLDLINDLLDMTKIEADKFTLSHRRVNLIDELDEVGRAFASRARLHGLTLDWMIDPCLARYISTDPVRVSQILTNLVGNAIKFTHTGYVSLEAKLVSSTIQKAHVKFIVRDSGPGIDPSEIKNLFQPFTQAESGISHSVGAGLGLSISKQLTTLLGGDIHVNSEKGKGAIFTVTLDFPWAEEPPSVVLPTESFVYSTHITRRHWYLCALIRAAGFIPIDIKDYQPNTISPAGLLAFSDEKNVNQFFKRIVLIDSHAPELIDKVASPTFAYVSAFKQSQIINRIKNDVTQSLNYGQLPKTIYPESCNSLYVLVIDDHFVNGTILTHQLQTLGCMVDFYSDSLEALEAFDPDSHQLILTDISMPNMSGWELASRVKKISPAIPIIAVSANVRLKATQSDSNVFDMILIKPLTTAKLNAAIQELRSHGALITHQDMLEVSDTPTKPYHFSPELQKKMVSAMDSDMENCRNAVEKLDILETEQFAHRIRGAFLTMGLRKAAMLCANLEAAAIAADTNSFPTLLEEVYQEWRNVRPTLLAASSFI